jgi:tyrosine-protein phosphatase 2/3
MQRPAIDSLRPDVARLDTQRHRPPPMDFFSATPAHTDALAALSSPTLLSTAATTNPPSSTDAFAEAINARYSRKGSNLLIPLSPAASPASSSQTPGHSGFSLPAPAPIKLASPLAIPPSAPSSSDNFTPVVPSSVRNILDTALVIDIRPHNAHALARLPNALSLSVPSTLIKRPLFSLEKLSQMLSSSHARDMFVQWPNASSILVYDADSTILNEGGNLLGLLRKFRKEGFTRQLFWLKGGFKAVWRESLELVDQERILDEDDTPAPVESISTAPLRAKQLPMSAFSMTTTTSSRQVSVFVDLEISSFPGCSSSKDARYYFFQPHFVSGRLHAFSSSLALRGSSTSTPVTCVCQKLC